MLQKYPPINWALLIYSTFISQHVSTLNRVLFRWVYILNSKLNNWFFLGRYLTNQLTCISEFPAIFGSFIFKKCIDLKRMENSNLFITTSTKVHQNFLGIIHSIFGDKPTRTWSTKGQCKQLFKMKQKKRLKIIYSSDSHAQPGKRVS